MTLPASARRVTIVVLRPTLEDPPEVDDWNRPVRVDDAGDPPEVLRTIGDLQPAPRGDREGVQSQGGGVVVATHIAFTDVVDIRNADTLRIEPDDGLRYDVLGVNRPGIGRRLDHLEVRAVLVTSGTAARV